MKPLTVLMPDVDPGLVTRSADLFDRLAATVETSPVCEGPNPSVFAPRGNPAYASGSSRTWDDGGVRTTMWSDGLGSRIVFRFDTVDGEVNVEMEMPRILTFLRDRRATSRLAADMAKRLRGHVQFHDARAMRICERAEGIMSALCLETSQETGGEPCSGPVTVRFPSPLLANEPRVTFARRNGLELCGSRALAGLISRRLPSTLCVSTGGSRSRIRIASHTIAVAQGRLDTMEILRMTRAAEGQVPHDHPPLVKWLQPNEDER